MRQIIRRSGPRVLVDHFTYGQPLVDIAAKVPSLEGAGIDGWFVAESNRDPFLAAAIASEHSERFTVGTGIALAFVRNPMTVAYLAHDLQELSGGRFVLGLGSQVKAHIERRFGAEWGHPVDRMREFISAFHTIWDAWRQGTDVSFEGIYYRHTLMPPAFRPDGPPQRRPPILLAAVGPHMTRLAGTAADGVLCHPFSGPRYLREVTLPRVICGAAEAQRNASDLTISASVLVATGRTEEAFRRSVRETRERIAFYASTPAYRPVLEIHGWDELHEKARRLVQGDRWEELGDLVNDTILEAFAVQAPPHEVGAVIADRYGGLLDRVNISTSHTFSPAEWSHILADLHATSGRTSVRNPEEP